MTKAEALSQIAERITQCFGENDFGFDHRVYTQQPASALRAIAQRAGLSPSEIRTAITPPIKDWLETGYYDHDTRQTGPWKDEEKRATLIEKLVHEASWSLAAKHRL